jgi:hypothetical protein
MNICDNWKDCTACVTPFWISKKGSLIACMHSILHRPNEMCYQGCRSEHGVLNSKCHVMSTEEEVMCRLVGRI